MDPLAAGLMLLAGLLHASWHAIVKAGTGLPILVGMGVVGAACALPFLFVVPVPPRDVWPILALSVALHAGYKISLAQAYRSADFSAAYPVARGLVPLFAAALAWLLTDRLPTPAQFSGVLLIVGGTIGLVLRPGSGFRAASLTAALTASLMVAGYSVVDGWGARAGAGWASYTAWLIVLDSIAFLTLARLVAGPQLWPGLVRMRIQVVIAGLLGVTSFAVFVWALAFNPVANVTAFRECSVLFGALIGAVVFRERLTPGRLALIGTIAAGLVVIVAFNRG